MAGCVFSVSLSWSSGPSKQSRDSGKPNASSACWKIRRAAGNASANVLPIPACCDPWPGNKNAVFMSLVNRARFAIHVIHQQVLPEIVRRREIGFAAADLGDLLNEID